MTTTIINPYTGSSVSIFNNEGRELLKGYILNYSLGGASCKKCELKEEAEKKRKELLHKTIENLWAKTSEDYKRNFTKMYGYYLDIEPTPCEHMKKKGKKK